MNKILRKQIFNIAVCAIFTALAVIVGRLSIYIPVMGLPSTRFSLFSIPIILGSLILGPIYGGIIGGLGDLIGALAFPVGAYFFGFTLDGILLGVIPGLIALFTKKVKISPAIIMGMLLLLVFGLLTHFFINYETVKISGTIIELDITIKIIIAAIYVLLFVVGFCTLYFLYKHQKRPIIINAFLAVFANELLVSALFASIWKTMLYSLPYFLNVGIALIYMLLNIPLKTLVISLIYPPIITMINTQKKSLTIDDTL